MHPRWIAFHASPQSRASGYPDPCPKAPEACSSWDRAQFHEGYVSDYEGELRAHKFCLAVYGCACCRKGCRRAAGMPWAHTCLDFAGALRSMRPCMPGTGPLCPALAGMAGACGCTSPSSQVRKLLESGRIVACCVLQTAAANRAHTFTAALPMFRLFTCTLPHGSSPLPRSPPPLARLHSRHHSGACVPAL